MNIVVNLLVWSSYIITLFFLIYWFLVLFESRERIKREYKQRIKISYFPLVSVLVPAFNEEKTIEKTLKSLVNLNWPKDKIEIIVINDGSTDGTSDVVKAFQKKHSKEPIRLMEQKNMGKATALNNGLKVLKGEFFACLDADSFVQKNTMKRLVFWHQQDSELAIVTPIMRVHKPRNALQKFQRLEYIVGMFLSKLMSFKDCNYVAPGPFSMYKTKVIKKVGGFDVNSLVEDQEIAYRVQAHHYRILQAPKAFVDTIAPHTPKQLEKQRNRWYRGTLENIVKYRSLIFNRTFGDFGMFQVPLNVFAFLLSGVALIAFSYFTLKPIFSYFYNWWLIGFDFWPYLDTFKWSYDLFSLQVTPLFILYIMLTMTLIFLVISSHTNDERVREHGWLYLVPYFFVYFLLIAFFMIKVVVEVILGKKQRW